MNRHQRRVQARSVLMVPDADYARAAEYYYAGNLYETERLCRRVLAGDPAHPRALYMLGMIAFSTGAHGDAVEWIGRAIEVHETAEARNDRGLALRALGRFEEAATELTRAIWLRPDIAVVHYNLSVCLLDIGLINDAMGYLDEAIRLGHAPAGIVQQLLYKLGVTLEEIASAARRWAERCLPKAIPLPRSSRLLPRLGFISGDLYAHTVGFMVYPTLRALSARGVAFTLYSTSARDDDHTAKIRDTAACWRDISTLSDEQARDLIVADGVDILVDLSGHTDTRAGVLARRAAPVQIWGWLGSAATSGIPAMDYILGDRYQIPAGAEAHYSEKVVRLPDSYVTFEPPIDAPELACSPRRPVTFGSFNALKKIGYDVLVAWHRILERVPDSRLILKAPAADGPLTKARLLDKLRVAPERVDIVGATSRQEHLEWMGRADIALDSFTYSGCHTTLECLWMGLPVVALPDKETFAGRHSLSCLSTIGLTDFVAHDVDDYVEKAVGLAQDPLAILQIRTGLRARMLASPLCDHDAFAAYLMAAFARMWGIYRDGREPEAFDV